MNKLIYGIIGKIINEDSCWCRCVDDALNYIIGGIFPIIIAYDCIKNDFICFEAPNFDSSQFMGGYILLSEFDPIGIDLDEINQGLHDDNAWTYDEIAAEVHATLACDKFIDERVLYNLKQLITR